MEKARTPMRRRVKVHSTPPKAFRRRSTLPLEATEDWGSGIAVEKQSFGAAEAREPEVYRTFSCLDLAVACTLDWEKSRQSPVLALGHERSTPAAFVHASRTKWQHRNKSLEQCRQA
jgi:hypothetical protein